MGFPQRIDALLIGTESPQFYELHNCFLLLGVLFKTYSV